MISKRLLYIITSILLTLTVVIVGGTIYIVSRPEPKSTRIEQLLQWEAETLLNDERYAQQFIRTGQPEERYNCHGWTFTMGRRAVGVEEVHTLLKSGRYTKVPIPVPGDVVIYYDKSGEICHSGIVKATGRGQFVLIESKWGGAGRFLHMVNVPKVSVSHEYYRRNMGGMRRPMVPSDFNPKPVVTPSEAM